MSPEATCRKFAEFYPTPQVLRAIALAEDGTLTWEQVEALFAKALGVGLEETR